MNYKFKLDSIEGDWIVQRTNYSLLKNILITRTNQISWKKLTNISNKTESILKKFLGEYSISDYGIYTKTSNNRAPKLYKFFLYNEEIKKGKIIKLDKSGNIISKANLKYQYSNSLIINYKYHDCYVRESIYFINANLKIVKSIIQKNSECIGTSFASEIKIC